MLKGFNSIFINLLYENEKHYLQPYLQYLQTKRTKDQDSVLYSSSFSAIYLVRYLIYLLTVKTSLNIHDLEEQSGQLQKKKRRVTTSMIMDENHPSKEEILSQEIYEMAMKLLDYLASDLYIGYVMSN